MNYVFLTTLGLLSFVDDEHLDVPMIYTPGLEPGWVNLRTVGSWGQCGASGAWTGGLVSKCRRCSVSYLFLLKGFLFVCNF